MKRAHPTPHSAHTLRRHRTHRMRQRQRRGGALENFDSRVFLTELAQVAYESRRPVVDGNRVRFGFIVEDEQ